MRCALLALVCVVGCDERAPGRTTSNANGRGSGVVPDGLGIETFVTPLQIAAGGVVDVACVVSQSGAHVQDATTAVEVQPPPSSLTETAAGYSARFNRAGEYIVRCTTLEGALVSRDVHVNVAPGAPVGIDTVLTPASAGAGAPVAVTCTATDIYGNAQPETRPTGIDAGPTIRVDPITTTTPTVRGTTVGTYNVACRLGALVDSVPAALTVTPGLPAHSQTTVNSTDVTPTAVVNVSCAVTDAYGNPVSAPSSVVVMPANDAPASVTGLQKSGMSFTAAKSGLYYVFCTVPGYQAGDESPALVSVHPGLPCTWAYDALDTTGCFWQGRRLPFFYEVFDYWGNVIDPAPFDMVAIPSTGVTSDGQGGWTFAIEGDYDLAFSVLAPHDTNPAHGCVGTPGTTTLPYIANVRVDSRGPLFAIAGPARSAMITLGTVADIAVPVSGTVIDTVSPIASLVLNGAPLLVSGASLIEPILATQMSRWGLNTITGEAVDECGNRSVLAQAYLRSGQYFTAATAPNAGSRAVTGILAHMNQPVIDDGNRVDVDDLATMAERIMQAQDFNVLMPAGTDFASDLLRGGCSGCPFGSTWTDTAYLVERHPDPGRRINWAGPYVLYLQAINGGMNFGIRLSNFDFPLRIWAALRACVIGCQSTDSIDLPAWAGASQVDATGTLGISLTSGTPQVTVQSMTVNTSGLYFSVDCGILQFICDGLTGLIISALRSQIEGALANAIAGQIPGMIQSFLANFTLDTGFNLPPPINLTLNLASGLDRVVFAGPAGSGWGELGLYTQVFPSARGTGIPSTALGAIRKDGALPPFSSTAYTFGMGLKDDLINQMLWALWYGGGMDLPDVTSLFGGSGIEGVNMSFAAGLPPVIMPGRTGTPPSQIDIGFGDIFVDASVDLGMLLSGTPGDTINVGIYLTMIAGASLDIDPTVNELLVAVDPNPQIYVQVVTIDDPGYQALMSDLFSRLLAIVAPNLVASVLGSFPIPEFDLGSLAGLPPGTVWRLTNAGMDRPGDYYRLTGSLQ